MKEFKEKSPLLTFQNVSATPFGVKIIHGGGTRVNGIVRRGSKWKMGFVSFNDGIQRTPVKVIPAEYEWYSCRVAPENIVA
ncbi:MAG: hypothetical protein ACTSUE_12470 [Promethearchaeota archaeon]